MRRERTLEGVPEQLWRLVSLAGRRLLMLDYDGTLAPFTVARNEAYPLARSVELLRRVALESRTEVAIVSGRPVRDVERLLGPLPAQFIGDHGWERRAPDGTIVQRPLSRPVAETIDEAERVARAAGWGELLERKRPAVVLHTRSLPANRAAAIEEQCVARWQELAATGHVSIDRIDGGVELRARGRDKGAVVLSLVSHSPPGTLAVFVGDDVTDEDAFDAVREWGFGVRVGDGGRPSLAMGRVPTVESVADFLEEWLAITRTTPRTEA